MKGELNYVEAIATIFTVMNSEIYVLLQKNKKEPYKGYWILPSKMIKKDISLEETISSCLEEQAGLPVTFIKEGNTFSAVDRKVEKRVIGINHVCLVDSKTVELKQKEISKEELDWFPIRNLPKVGFDNLEIIESSIEQLQTLLMNKIGLKYLFPSDFSLPEMQRVYESALGHPLDRRNFRKRFMQNDLIEETGYKTEGTTGRPAKLYRLKEIEEENELF